MGRRLLAALALLAGMHTAADRHSADLAEQAGPRHRAGDAGQRARHHRAGDRRTAVGATRPDLRGREPHRRRRHHRRRVRRQVGARRLHHPHSFHRRDHLPGDLRQSAVRHRARLRRGDAGGQRAAGAGGLAVAAQVAQGAGGGGEGETRRDQLRHRRRRRRRPHDRRAAAAFRRLRGAADSVPRRAGSADRGASPAASISSSVRCWWRSR